MYKKTIAAIGAHALAEYPRECCGLLVAIGRKEKYVACRNLAKGTDHFILAPEDYAAAEDQGKVIAVIHSHPDMPARSSEADRVACEASGLPWHIISIMPDDTGALIADDIRSIAPDGYQAPLIGRPFSHGVLDCYTLIRDCFAREFDIVIPDFERQDKWWEGEQELYLDGFPKAGFAPLRDGEPLRPGDVILMQLRSDRTNHGGVFMGDRPLKEAPYLHRVPDAMLHHVYGHLSERAVYGGHWKEITRMILRHKDLV